MKPHEISSLRQASRELAYQLPEYENYKGRREVYESHIPEEVLTN
jgi:hypothetical protein